MAELMCVKVQRNITAFLMGFFGIHTQTLFYCFGTNPFFFASVSGIDLKLAEEK